MKPEIRTVYRDDGKTLWYTKEYVNGKQHGLETHYQKDGETIFWASNYVNGELNGFTYPWCWCKND